MPNPRDPAELLALAATQLERATSATAHLLERNDAQVTSVAERLSVIETKIDGIHARLKKLEKLVEGTLEDKGLKERFHGIESEIQRLVTYIGWIDQQFKSDFFKAKEPKFSLSQDTGPSVPAVVLPILAGAALVALIVYWLLR